jgi:indolepyruvate ferredoxin oxidoreductase
MFYPGNTQETLDYGLYAIALSRWSGAWSAMKMVTNICDGGGTVNVEPERLEIRIPEGYEKKYDARLIIPFTLMLEAEVNSRRLDAAREFARLNSFNRSFGARENARLGILTAGKSYYDLMQALRDLRIGRDELDALGIRIGKLAMTFPIEPRFITGFADGLETMLVVEEKRSFIELQLRETLYNQPRRPIVIGKHDREGKPLLPASGELDPELIARVLVRLLGQGEHTARLRLIEEIEARERRQVAPRLPTFCSGCPHNRSTLLLDGQIAGGGIGCHGMAATLTHINRGYAFLTHMGGEGAPWIGMSEFVDRPHIFQNLGDGTYFHSGAMAVAACVAAGVNITYKILYNSAVAMTGGQQAAGAMPVPALTHRLKADGVVKTMLLVEDVGKYADVSLADNVTVRDRDDLPDVLRELEQVKGVTVILYDQQCAAEKRRQRARGKQEEPTRRLVINERVCEGCGDCVRQSNCVSLYPVETPFGAKTRIHQSSCNKDYSCALGDCPSFVTVELKEGTGLRPRRAAQLPAIEMSEPRDKVRAGDGYSILAPGIGGTGVVTINALLATAAWIEGLSSITLDQTGLAQKGGAVVSSIVLSEKPIEAAAKIGYGNADLLLGFDLLGAASAENLKRAHPDRTAAVVNTAEVPTADVVRGAVRSTGPAGPVDVINGYTERGRNVFVDASRIAEGLFASHMAVNVFLLGVAYQAGLLPLRAESIEEAIRLNRVEAERNLQAFVWGRKYYQDARAVEDLVSPPRAKEEQPDLAGELERYQGRAYADRYREFLREVEAKRPEIRDTVARYLYKLMAYKDEYEVARLLTLDEFDRQLDDMWAQVEQVSYNLHPPLLRAMGMKKKLKLGPWFRGPLRLLAKLKFLRGTPFDVFGYAEIRREERKLVDWYRALVQECMQSDNVALALEIAALPDQIRGYENIKLQNIRKIKALADEKQKTLNTGVGSLMQS